MDTRRVVRRERTSVSLIGVIGMSEGARARVARLMLTVMLVSMAAAVALLAGCGQRAGDRAGEDAANGAAAGEPVKIGAVLSLSGSLSGLGIPARQAIEVEVERINGEGGVNGRLVEVVFEDDASDEAKAVAATTRLIEQEDVLAVIGGSGTAQSMAMRTEIERAEVPQIALAGGSVVTDQLSPWVFQTPWPNRVVVPFTLRALQEAGVTRLALISESGGYGVDGQSVTEANVKRFGIEIVATEQFNRGDTVMTSQLTKIRAADPDAVLMWSAGAEAATIMKNNAALGAADPLPFYGAPGNARREFLEGSGEAAEGFMFAAGHILAPETYGEDTEAYNVATAFIERFTARWGVEPDIFAGHAYDALHITVEAARRVSGDLTPEALRDEIEATSGLVAIGGTFTFSATDHNGMSEDALTMYTIIDGEWIPAEKGR